MADLNRQIVLKRRPDGMPGLDNFELTKAAVPEPGDGELLMRTLYLSLDPKGGAHGLIHRHAKRCPLLPRRCKVSTPRRPSSRGHHERARPGGLNHSNLA